MARPSPQLELHAQFFANTAHVEAKSLSSAMLSEQAELPDWLDQQAPTWRLSQIYCRDIYARMLC